MIRCPSCKNEIMYKSKRDGRTRLKTRMVVFNEDLTKAFSVCGKCKAEVALPISLGKLIREEFLYIRE